MSVHVPVVEFDASKGRWGWRCPCGSWGRSLLFGREWADVRAAEHVARAQRGAPDREASRTMAGYDSAQRDQE